MGLQLLDNPKLDIVVRESKIKHCGNNQTYFSKMTASPIETPNQKVTSIGESCDKVYASKGNMMNHFKKSHKAAVRQILKKQ